MSPYITVIKIGGSVLTDKTKPETPMFRKKRAQGLAQEFAVYLKQKSPQERFILIHGAGSFGHSLAKRYKLTECKARKDLTGVALTRVQVRQLNLFVAKEFLERRCKVLPLSPSFFVRQTNGRIFQCDIACIKSALEEGFTPLLHGDVVEDKQCGFSICSGDQLIAYLSSVLPIHRAIFLTDVNGIFTDDPKHKHNAQFIVQMTKKEAKALARKRIRKTSFDVTNAMAGKLGEIAEMSCPVVVCSGLERGNLLHALRGENVGTTIY